MIVDPSGVNVNDASEPSPTAATRLERSAKYHFIFLELKIPMDEMDSKLVLDVEAGKHICQLLQMNHIYLRLNLIVREEIITV
ncbi:hypothetical protein N7452_009121 [Penicillium brevicompactum]|uniref:Uncharacterized protein n=1 Tax=Penicillium brevicompactum TaxID=5074 RepID=A0A9W9U9Y2_PENBR|nr:hypothetical protein N7452_009121 [Penicillium brevicompactum]